MNTIYKYNLKLDNTQTIEMPRGAKILDIQFKTADRFLQGELAMWAMVNTNKEIEERIFKLFGTGFEINYEGDKSLIYLSTVQFNNAFDVHVFEVK